MPYLSPSNEGLGILVRKKGELTDKEWFDLVEARREMIKPYLDTFTLPELGSLECLRTYKGLWNIYPATNAVISGDERFSLKTQGIFYYSPESRKYTSNTNYPDGVVLAWGLTRSAIWILVEIEFKGSCVDDKNKLSQEYAKSVTITEANLSVIVTRTKESPLTILRCLGKSIKELTAHREMLYNQALELVQMIEFEESAISLITGNHLFFSTY